MAKKTLYTAQATATGGRDGRVRSSDGVLNLQISAPRALGGREGATNPEQLFAAGYASCFQHALLIAAGQDKRQLNPDFTVACEVALQQDGDAYALAATLTVDLKDQGREQAVELTRRALEICPYSAGIRGNMEVRVYTLDSAGERSEIANAVDHK